jgi:hypothetical protein
VRSAPWSSALAWVEDSVNAAHNDSDDNNADALIAVMGTSFSGSPTIAAAVPPAICLDRRNRRESVR